MKIVYNLPVSIYLPTEYDHNTDQKKYPFILFLHGQGGSKMTPTNLNSREVPSNLKTLADSRSTIIMAPISYGEWIPAEIDAAIESALNQFRIDESKMILAGLSMGGGGALYYATSSAARAKRFPVIIAIAPTNRGTNFRYIAEAQTKVYFFHAKNDTTVSPSSTSQQSGKILLEKPVVKPVVELWDTGGHGIWNTVFGREDVFDDIYRAFEGPVVKPIPGDEVPPVQPPPDEQEPVEIGNAEIVLKQSEIFINEPAESVILNAKESKNIKAFYWKCIDQPLGTVVDIRNPTAGETQVRYLSRVSSKTNPYLFELEATGTDGLIKKAVVKVHVWPRRK